MTTVAVIPVKQLQNAKQRLSGVLSAEQRGDLLRAMLEDVLEAVTTCDRIDAVRVVTDDPEVASIAVAYGALVMGEPAEPGLIESVTAAGRALAEEGVDRMVFLPADVPLASVPELEMVMDGMAPATGPAFMIVPARDLGGSNCVVCEPPDCMTFAFGEDSFNKHCAIARQLGIEPVIARLPGIGMDIDTPDDLADLVSVLVSENLMTNTRRLLDETGYVASTNANALRTGP